MLFKRNQSVKSTLKVGLDVKFERVEEVTKIPNLLDLFTSYGWEVNKDSFDDESSDAICEFKHKWVKAYLTIEAGWSSANLHGYFFIMIYYKGKYLQLEFEDFKDQLLKFNNRGTRKELWKHANVARYDYLDFKTRTDHLSKAMIKSI